MRTSLPCLLILPLLACAPKVAPQTATSETAEAPPAAAAPAAPAPKAEPLAADTPKTTVEGNTFIAPAGWTVTVKGPATILTPPEPDSHLAIIDVKAANKEQALEQAWAAYLPSKPWPVQVTTPAADKDGWTQVTNYGYLTSPNEKRGVGASARFANGVWTVVIYDMTDAVGEKRSGQTALVYGQLLPKGFERESFAGKKAHPLDAQRLAALGAFIESGMKQLGIPGVALGLVQDGKVVFAGGYGVRELGKPGKVDGDTRFIIASNTKALTTLMLAKLVDQKKLTWDTQATTLLPSFKLGDADTTSKVLVKHLICACTGMPRQDMEWLLEYGKLTPDGALATLATMQPTSKFGELFQYSNPLAAAAGYIGGHVASPKLELGKAYDEAMKSLVFDPLGMKNTTFDFKKAETGNFAQPHSHDLADKTALALSTVNTSIVPVRPAGGAWSSVKDVLKYVQMELAEGALPNGKRYVSKEPLLARRAPQVAIGKDTTYGMGLMVHTRWGTTVVAHGGDMIGFHSDMMWLPEHNVGAVILTNGDPGWLIRSLFRRKLLEVLFDGKPEADADLAAAAKSYFENRASERKLWVVPAEAPEAAKLAAKYVSKELGAVTVSHAGPATIFDFGEWKSEVASKKNPDGTVSFVTTVPGMEGVELVVGKGPKRSLIMRDAQHEYVFEES